MIAHASQQKKADKGSGCGDQTWEISKPNLANPWEITLSKHRPSSKRELSPTSSATIASIARYNRSSGLFSQ